MFFVATEGWAAAMIPTCRGPYSDLDSAIAAAKSIGQAGTYVVYGPADIACRVVIGDAPAAPILTERVD